MVYQWKIPNLYNIPAQKAGEEIESCKNSEGFITPAAVVEKAKVKTSVIHDCFEWDDRSAAERYRLHQAGELIRNIVAVSVSGSDSQNVAVRAFVNVKSESERGYKAISAVVENRAEYEYLLDCAKNDMRAFTQKYAALQELREVFAAIQEVLT
ncbi:hypothetical protein [Candidatus Soleaferrea massiliensis]|uniref:hypothetical protein n=1 Tax=Candidatus Soleaferrea massiliensis TaxID=1470354 RepID=UPI00058E432B|nr:hypothetical protein [Candidatus Soleaferrea massiliensis]